MASLGSIMVQIGLDASGFQRGLDRAESAMKSAGDSFKNVGESMAKALTIPLTAIGGGALASAIMVEDSQNMIQAQLGITGDKAGELQGVVNDIFKDGLGGDMTEVQNSVTTVIRQMNSLEGASDEMVEQVARNTLNLSKTFEADSTDVSKSINAMQTTFKDFSTEDAFDNIAKGFQSGLDYSGDFLDTVNEFSVHFEKMGFSADEMFGFLNAGAEAGVYELNKVGDLVKEMNIRFSDNTAGDFMEDLSGKTNKLYKTYQKTGEGGTEVFQSIMGDLAGMDDKQKAYTIGVGLMGTQFEDLDMTAVQALANVQGGLEGVDGSMDALNGSVNNGLGVTLSSAFRTVQLALVPLGQEIGKIIREYLPPLMNQVEKVSTWFTGLSDKAKKLVVAIGGIGLVVPILLIGLGILLTVFGSIAGAISAVIGVFAGMALVTVAISGAIAVFVAMLVVAYMKSEVFRDAVNKAFVAIKDVAVEVFAYVSDFVREKITEIKDFWDKHGEEIQSAFEKVVGAVGKVFKVVFPIIKSIVMDTIKSVMNVIDGLITFFMGFIRVITSAINGDWAGAWEGLKQMVSGAVQAVWGFVNLWVVGKVLKIFKGFGGKIKTATSDVGKKMAQPFKDGYNKVKEWVDKITDKVKNMFNTHIKKPSFSFTGSLNPTKWATDGLPKLGINWNAKGNIFNGASVLGGGQGVGEAGAEAVLPIQHKRYMKPFASSIASHLKDMKGDGDSQGVINNFEIAQLVVREDADVQKIAVELERIQRKQQRAKGTLAFG